MLTRRTRVWLAAACGAGLLVSLYQVLFCLWMLAHPLYASPGWRQTLAIRLGQTAFCAAALILLAIAKPRSS